MARGSLPPFQKQTLWPVYHYTCPSQVKTSIGEDRKLLCVSIKEKKNVVDCEVFLLPSITISNGFSCVKIHVRGYPRFGSRYCKQFSRNIIWPWNRFLSFFFFFFRKKVPRCIFVRIKVYLTVYNATTTHQTEEDIETEKQQIKKLNGLKNWGFLQQQIRKKKIRKVVL